MSDLSNNTSIISEEPFDACRYMRSLCENTQITIPSIIDFEFDSGWKNIIKDFVDEIKNYSIAIVHMTDSYNQLDITFEAMGEPNELRVWRAIEKVRQISHKTCASCGNRKENRHKRGTLRLLCQNCAENSTKNGKTGTWLDKF